jgi:DNA-binding response OmpR family regulator
VLKQVRQSRPTLPVIVLTARGDENDRVAGLRQGADDYVVKPFSVKELLARVEAVLRRSPGRPGDIERIDFSGGVADLKRAEVRLNDGRRAELSQREAELLRYLAANAGRAIARDELLAHVWRVDPRGITTRTIDMHVARLREKLGDDPDEPTVIVTVRGRGYMLATAGTP